jgi:hypothetical protein
MKRGGLSLSEETADHRDIVICDQPAERTAAPRDIICPMDEIFTIMQIGDEQMDEVYEGAIDPAIRAAGFQPRRVDRHNEGDLLKSEIVKFIERSPVIVADVTNERPNCYLEIGYAMGLGKKANLILTAREDHHHSSENFDRNGPKVHFDLEGYSILFWNPAELDSFRKELGRLIERRAAIVATSPPTTESPPAAVARFGWVEELRAKAEQGLVEVGRNAYLEVAAELRPPGSWSQKRLLDDLRSSSIHAFGWPVALILDGDAASRPRPTSDGVVAKISVNGKGSPNPFGQDRTSYDFWKLFRDGRFFTLFSLFEDERAPGSIFFEVRISRVVESLLLLSRFYRRLGASDTDELSVRFRHHGLAGKVLRAAQRSRFLPEHSTAEDTVESTITATLADLEANPTPYAKEVINPLFVVFEFFELGEGVFEEVAQDFLAKC